MRLILPIISVAMTVTVAVVFVLALPRAGVAANTAVASEPDYICTFKPNKTSVHGKSPIPEFVTIKIDPENRTKIAVTDIISLTYNGAASQGAVVMHNGQVTLFTWAVRIVFHKGHRGTVRYNLRMKSKTGKATLTATMAGSPRAETGHGKCVLH